MSSRQKLGIILENMFALYDNSLLRQFTKYNNFHLEHWFLVENLLNLYPTLEILTTHITVYPASFSFIILLPENLVSLFTLNLSLGRFYGS